MSKKKNKSGSNIPVTVTESIPYEYVYENGIFEISPGKFSKSYHIPEANFKTSSQQEQYLLAQRYSEFLGEVDPNILIQITLYNKTVDIVKFQEDVLFDMCADELNSLREEYNEMLVEKMTNAKNNLQTIKILTLTLEENGIDNATEKFAQLDTIISDSFSTMTKHDALPLSLIERMEILDHIWNKMIANKAKGKRTWIFIDEFHMLMQKPSAASYIAQIWKRARKWSGICTAITQNIEDMLKSEDSRTIINNSSFIILLGQSPINKEHLSNLLNISKEEQKFISSAKPGTGLLRIKDDIIPMTDSFPKNTELYKIMTTKPNES